MKILHVHRDGGISGSERHLLELLPALQALGADVEFVALRSAAGPGRLEAAMTRLGVATHAVEPRPHLDMRTSQDLARIMRSVNPTLVHTHLIHADIWGGSASMLRRRPFVSTMHAAEQRHHTALNRLALRGIWSRAAAVIAISDHVARFLRERRLCAPAKIHVVKYGVPPAAASPAAIQNPGPRVLVASRLIPQKGHRVLLDAWSSISAAHPTARLLIAGDGPLRSALEDRSRDLGTAETVDFLGFRDDISVLYAQADVVVFPTEEGFGEGFGLVNLEALQHAKPVVASRKDSVPEIVIDGECGLLVPPGDAAALATALDALLADPARAAAMGAAGARRATEEFSLERMATKTLDVYTRVLAS